MTESDTTQHPGLRSEPDSPEVQHLRMVEAILFAAGEPLAVEEIAEILPEGADVAEHLAALQRSYADRGINLVRVGDRYMFRTAPDLAFLLRREVDAVQRLSRAGVETLAIIAYHQPVTRAEIEEIRGVGLSKGTLDTLLEAEWIRPRGRKRTPGRPLMYVTTDAFLAHFGLESLDDLPGLGELKAAGLLDSVDEALARMEEMAGEGDGAADDEENQSSLDLDARSGDDDNDGENDDGPAADRRHRGDEQE